MPRRGTLLLSGALPIADSLAPPRTHQSVPLSTILTLPQNSVTEIHSLIVVPELAAIQPWRGCPNSSRHNGSILAAINNNLLTSQRNHPQILL